MQAVDAKPCFMKTRIHIYNSLKREKELFEPIKPPLVGLYVCGPTVYGDPHLGHARPAITFDVVFRYLQHLGYKVRYIRNITDVGHLEDDADEGEDKIAKKARLEKLEPMEIVQHYSNLYHQAMDMLNVLPPSIEPRATGHIIEQQEMIKRIVDNGYGYETNGSVYFNVEKYNRKHHYGILSGRNIEQLYNTTRDLQKQSEKINPYDFALWKKADPQHIMKWPSIWGEGFPGWHMECSTMSMKYLGAHFDIHGGGIDLQFPHHDCEIAQSMAVNNVQPAKYWMHNNMITINGKKMGKSLGNAINLFQIFNGDHPLLEKAYSPMTVRFFMLQAHYTSTLDFSNQALEASEKGMKRLFQALKVLDQITPSQASSIEIKELTDKCHAAMNDDFNTPVAIAHLFEGARQINSIHDGSEQITAKDLDALKNLYHTFIFDILGLKYEQDNESVNNELTDELIRFILALRLEAKKKKDFSTADYIRDELNKRGIEVKDKKDGFEWEFKNE